MAGCPLPPGRAPFLKPNCEPQCRFTTCPPSISSPATARRRSRRSRWSVPSSTTSRVGNRICAPPIVSTLRAPWRRRARSEARWRHGEPKGALDGVPITIKDNIATKGVPVPLGTAASDLTPAPADAPPAARVREEGAVILGKTTMPDYGMLSSGLSSFHPLTRNPWNLAKNPGGSSSGAGAAAAAGYAPLHLGTDIGGSVRLPATWCGIFTLKPSLGLVPDRPALYRSRRGADDANRGRCGASDERHLQTRCARPYEPALPATGVRRARALAEGPAHRPASRSGLRLAGRAASEERGRGGGAGASRSPAPSSSRCGPSSPARCSTASIISGACAPISTSPPLPEARRAKALPFIVDWAMSAKPFSGTKTFKDFSQIMATRQATVTACRPMTT